MKTIYKYELGRVGRLKIDGLVKVQSVAEQNGGIVLYAIVDTESSDTGYVEFAVYGTGHTLDDLVLETFTFQGTVNLGDGALMFHVYTKQS